MSSSIHIGKVTSGSFLHNDRTQKVSYLIDDSSLNECSRSSSDCLAEYQSLKLQASENYTKLTSQKMQKSTIFLKEAIVNLEEHHTLKDLEPIKERLESYGFTVLQMSIHRDEGFVNPDNQKQKNYHAHITMFNLDIESGKSVKFGKNYRTELSKLQTFTAQTLQMERGKVSVKEHADELKVTVSKASKRLDTHDYKKAMKIKEEALTQKEQYNFKDYQSKITALETLTTEQKKELHQLNSAVKNDRATIEELHSKIKELQTDNQALREHKKALITSISGVLKREQIEELSKLEPLEQFKKAGQLVKENVSKQKQEIKTLISDLQATIPLQTSNDTLKDDLERLKQNMSVLQHKHNTVKEDVYNCIDKEFEPKKSLKDRFIGFVRELKQTIQDQAKEIFSLKTQNQELKKENQEYKALVSKQVEELVPDQDELMRFKRELPKKLFTTSANDLQKELSSSSDPHKNEKIKIIDEHTQQQVRGFLKNSTAVTKEDLQKANQSKSQSRDYDLSR